MNYFNFAHCVVLFGAGDGDRSHASMRDGNIADARHGDDANAGDNTNVGVGVSANTGAENSVVDGNGDEGAVDGDGKALYIAGDRGERAIALDGVRSRAGDGGGSAIALEYFIIHHKISNTPLTAS